MAPQIEDPGLEDVREHLKRLEDRLARIESHLGLEAETHSEVAPPRGGDAEDAEERLEVQLGQNWFAQAGIIVLALGVVFLLTLPYPDLPAFFPSLFGYGLSACILALSHFWRKSFQQVSRYLLGGALLLLFFSTLRLSHFGPAPAVSTVWLEFSLLLTVVTVNLVVAWRRHSAALTGMALVAAYISALLGREPFLIFGMITGLSLVATAAGRQFGWRSIPLAGILLGNLTHLLWALNNPVAGNRTGLVTEPEANLLLILVYALVFAAGDLFRQKQEPEQPPEIVRAFVNGIASYLLFLLLTLTAFRTHLWAWHVAASVVYLMAATFFWTRRRSLYATFVYAMLGYSALSVAILTRFTIPECFVWLCGQSLIVVSTAVWFRSRFIVVANFVIFLLVFLAYLVATDAMGPVSISFGVVALISARILNWQKDRLELRTELMRNAYLASALFGIPLALYHTVPRGFVSLSWLGVALLYYLFSRLLNNRKYRWMALLTVSITILYVVLVDLVGVDPVLRIVSFLVVGSALLLISMFYTRRRNRAKSGVPGGDETL